MAALVVPLSAPLPSPLQAKTCHAGGTGDEPERVAPTICVRGSRGHGWIAFRRGRFQLDGSRAGTVRTGWGGNHLESPHTAGGALGPALRANGSRPRRA